MSEVKTTISLPAGLARQIQEQIQAGWFLDINSLVIEALRRYLETHRDELMERFIREDVEWGLQGDEANRS
jgi:Arc/MetJ-type ribon-helix-helix transcriptional regulator